MSRKKTTFQRPRPGDTIRTRLRIAHQRIIFTSRKRRGPPRTRRGYGYYRGRRRDVRLLPTGMVELRIDGMLQKISPGLLSALPM